MPVEASLHRGMAANPSPQLLTVFSICGSIGCASLFGHASLHDQSLVRFRCSSPVWRFGALPLSVGAGAVVGWYGASSLLTLFTKIYYSVFFASKDVGFEAARHARKIAMQIRNGGQ
eukprot:ANDGO_05018.mRNA.1 hypothetical protein